MMAPVSVLYALLPVAAAAAELGDTPSQLF
jgi:hypothetical protein